MEQQQRSLIFTAAVGLIILAIIVGSIYYLVKFIQGRVASNNQTPVPSVTEIATDFATPGSSPVDGSVAPVVPGSPAASPRIQTGAAIPDKKVHNVGEFQMAYPKAWGIVTCTNGKNVEFDPVNSADSNIACDIALKPVTVIVGDTRGCEGQTTKVGAIDVVKFQESKAGDIYYQWCTKTTPVLNITHRVSPQAKRGFSTQDFSKQVEEIIANLSFSRGS